ncbi:membrane metallo-endopeptidase-like protein, partial [Plakobranchus ocellatus]
MHYVINSINWFSTSEAKIEEIGVQPYLITQFAKEWPTLIGKNWPNRSSFDLNDVTTRYSRVGTMPLFSVSVSVSLTESRYTIYLDEPRLFMPGTLYMGSRTNSALKALETYLRDVAIELGADPAVAAQDATGVVDFQIKLAKIKASQLWNRRLSDRYHPTTLAAIGKNYSY